MNPKTPPRLILASKSKARQNMLKAAGLSFEAIPAQINEYALIQNLLEGRQGYETISTALAAEKAHGIAQDNPDSLVIGADQLLIFEDEILHKADDKLSAREKLLRLRGRKHALISGVALISGSKIIWQHAEKATLTMHNFDDLFLDHYIENAGDALTSSVGAYEIEGIGAWLFDQIEGDVFTIMGLPMLPLLQQLKEHHGVYPCQ